MDDSTTTPSTLMSQRDLPPEEAIFGVSEAMALVRRQVEIAAAADAPVLLKGPRGTGKEVIAQLIHYRPPQPRGRFLRMNRSEDPAVVLERELPGDKDTPLTGAGQAEAATGEAPRNHTLFLEEAAELEPSRQGKLLQLLRNEAFCRTRTPRGRRVPFRVMCTTNHDLVREVEEGRFRRDLYYRINVLSISLPALSERREDIPLLARYFTEKYSRKYRRPAPRLTHRILRILDTRPWPGNIRELATAVKRYVILGSEEAFAITPSDGSGHSRRLVGGMSAQTRPLLPGDVDESLKSIIRHAVKELEHDIILRTLEVNRWNRRRAARALRISYAALLYKMREAGVPPMRGPRADNVPEQLALPRARLL